MFRSVFACFVVIFLVFNAAAATDDVHVDVTKKLVTTKADGIKEIFTSKMNDFHNFVESEMDLLKYKLKGKGVCPAGWKTIDNSCIIIVHHQQTDYSWLQALVRCFRHGFSKLNE